ncbi:MAG: 16S rRNA (uracil(1498)-N(3))-methyltransferase [Alphaproteobacteria bacterium]|nr:16S rRNA (uracil(1498)-N(3))-methyltransferase [Alphaproteobacteria bacterium]
MTALPPRHRLFVPDTLAEGGEVELSPAHAHYLRDVLRLAPGAMVALFNGSDGEWAAELTLIGKSRAQARIGTRLRPQATATDLWLVFAPIKGHRLDNIVEKATELGVSVLQPVMTRRTVVSRVNLDRLRANAQEAAEQSERLDLPEIREPVRLERLLAGWPAGRCLVHCDERGQAPAMGMALAGLPAATPGAILTGPEGGFAPEEQASIGALAQVIAVTLGPRVLRADTAAIAAIALWQSSLGDWRG